MGSCLSVQKYPQELSSSPESFFQSPGLHERNKTLLSEINPMLPETIPIALRATLKSPPQIIINAQKFNLQDVSRQNYSCGFHVLGKKRSEAIQDLINFVQAASDVNQPKYQQIIRALLKRQIADQAQSVLDSPAAIEKGAEALQVKALTTITEQLESIDNENFFGEDFDREGKHVQVLDYLTQWQNSSLPIDSSGGYDPSAKTQSGQGFFAAFAALYDCQIHIYQRDAKGEIQKIFQANPPLPINSDSNVRQIHIAYKPSPKPNGCGHFMRLMPQLQQPRL